MSTKEPIKNMNDYMNEVNRLIEENDPITPYTTGIKLIIYCFKPNTHREGNISRVLWYPEYTATNLVSSIAGYLPRENEVIFERGRTYDIISTCYNWMIENGYQRSKDLICKMTTNTINRLVHRSFIHCPKMYYLGERTQ